MKFGRDELTQSVRLNDSMSEVQGLDDMAASFDVDMSAVEYVAAQRSAMAMQLIYRTIGIPNDPVKRIELQATLASIWCDGFFAALHMLQQTELDKA